MNFDFTTLKKKAYEGVLKKIKNPNKFVYDRLDKELNAIEFLNLSEYFLIANKIAEVCNELNILRSPGSSFSCGSLVNYCLDITKINPLDHGLYFEKFINRKLSGFGEIKFEISADKKDYLIGELENVLTQYSVYRIIFNIKSSEKGITRITIDNIEYGFQPNAILIIKNEHNLDFQVINDGGFKYLRFDSFKDSYLMWKYCYKIDGLEILSKIEKIIELVGESNHPYKLPVDDNNAFDLLRKGDNENIFKFDSAIMSNMCKEFAPLNIADLSFIFAFNRPPFNNYLQYYLNEILPKRFFKITQENFLNVNVNKILDESYGLIIYQETIIELMNKIAGLDLDYAASYSTIFGRIKKVEEEKIMINEFVKGCLSRGKLTEKETNELYHLIFPGYLYAFSKSHGIGVTTLTYWCSLYKANFRKEFDSVFCEKR